MILINLVKLSELNIKLEDLLYIIFKRYLQIYRTFRSLVIRRFMKITTLVNPLLKLKYFIFVV